MKWKSLVVILIITCEINLLAQDQATNIATTSFYSKDKFISSKEYDEKDFRDVYPFDPNDFFIRGVEKYDKAFFEEALIDFNESLKLFPECPICYYYRGINYMQLDSVDKAKSDFKNAIKYDPLFIEVYNDLGVIYMIENQIDSAKHFLNSGIDYYPAYPITYYNLGQLELGQNKLTKAIKQFKRCLEFDSCHVESYSALTATYLIRNNLKKAEYYLNRVLLCDSTASQIHMWKAILKATKNKLKEAILFMGEAINQDSSFYLYYAVRGYMHINAKNYDLAIDDFIKAYTINPIESDNYKGDNNYKVKQEYYQRLLNSYLIERFELSNSLVEVLNQIICLMLNENIQEANKKLKKVIKKEPKNSFIHLLLGITEEKLGNYELAISSYNLSIEIKSDLFEAYKRRGFLHQTMGNSLAAANDFSKMYSINPFYIQSLKHRGIARLKNSQYKLALVDFSTYYNMDTTDIDCLFNIGICQSQLGLHQEAIASFENVVQTKKEDTETYFEIAKLKYHLKDTIGALNVCDTILKTRNCHVRAISFKGIVYIDQQDYKKAIASFGHAIQCYPYFTDAYINRSIANMKIGNYQDALFDLNKAIEIEPNSGLAYYLRAKIKSYTQDNSACEDLEKAIDLRYKVLQSEIDEICMN